MQIQPKHLTLKSLFQGRLFRIPDYQRAYAWGAKQRDDLFADIREVHTSGQHHFMATVVCLEKEKREISADEYQEVEVVDGQQRLTTLVILMKAIERALDDTISQELKIKREILEELVKEDKFRLLLLQTNHDSSSIFNDYVRTGKIHDGDVDSAADLNIIEAAHECEAFVNSWKSKDDLIKLVYIIRNRLSVVYHELADETAVYRVFEVLNSRGLDVKWIDKLKSQLMAQIFGNSVGGARDEALSEMKNIWRDIYRTLGLRGALGDEALRFAGTMKSAERPNRLLSQEKAVQVLTEAAGTKLPTIVVTGDWLRTVVNAVNKVDLDIRLRAVTQIVHARFVAAAILLRGFPKKKKESLLGQWERVTFRVFGLGGADSRNKVGEYMRLGYDIIGNNITDDEISGRLEELGDNFSIGEILENIHWKERYHGWTEELRYLLFRYDEHLSREAGEKLNSLQWEKVWAQDPSKSIEHIEPQSSGVEYVHHLGNLTMLPPGVNSSLKDKPPLEKAEAYIQCGIKETVTVGSHIKKKKKWTKKDVLDRAIRIEKFIRKEWAD